MFVLFTSKNSTEPELPIQIIIDYDLYHKMLIDQSIHEKGKQEFLLQRGKEMCYF